MRWNTVMGNSNGRAVGSFWRKKSYSVQFMRLQSCTSNASNREWKQLGVSLEEVACQ